MPANCIQYVGGNFANPLGIVGSRCDPKKVSPSYALKSLSPACYAPKWHGPEQLGSWYNEGTKEYLRMDHSEQHAPHYDYRAPDFSEYRVYLDGRIEPK